METGTKVEIFREKMPIQKISNVKNKLLPQLSGVFQ